MLQELHLRQKYRLTMPKDDRVLIKYHFNSAFTITKNPKIDLAI